MAILTVTPTRTERQRLVTRRRTIAVLGPTVRAALAAAAEARWPDGRWELALTVYDAARGALDATDGHWTLTRFASPSAPAVESYTVSVCFDQHDQPVAFAVTGQRRILTAGARPELLPALLAELPPRRRRLGCAPQLDDWDARR